MKTLHLFSMGVCIVLAAGCSTTDRAHDDAAKSDPGTVLITYHVKPGKETELQAVLARAWEIYRKERLVFADPHIIVAGPEEGEATRFVEVFTWVSHDAPDHAPASVTKIWDEEHSLCEARGGHPGIEGGEVRLLTPARQ